MLDNGKTQLKQITDQPSDWKVPWTIYRPYVESYKSNGMLRWTFHKGQYFKPWNINLLSVSERVRKKIVEFTDSAHTIYWLKITFLCMSVLI